MSLTHPQGESSFLHIPMGVVEFYDNLWGNTSDPKTEKMVFFPTQVRTIVVFG